MKQPGSPSGDAKGRAAELRGLRSSPRKQTLWVCAAARPHKVVDVLLGLRLRRKWTQATAAQNNECSAYQSSPSNLRLSFKRSLNFDRRVAPAETGRRPAAARVLALAAALPSERAWLWVNRRPARRRSGLWLPRVPTKARARAGTPRRGWAAQVVRDALSFPAGHRDRSRFSAGLERVWREAEFDASSSGWCGVRND